MPTYNVRLTVMARVQMRQEVEVEADDQDDANSQAIQEAVEDGNWIIDDMEPDIKEDTVEVMECHCVDDDDEPQQLTNAQWNMLQRQGINPEGPCPTT